MNNPAAPRTSHGTSAANRDGGVLSNSHAPMPPPIKLGAANPIAHCRAPESSPRYPHMLLTVPGQSATVLVAFATIGEMPSPTSAGKVRSVPPPAMAFIAPATAEMRTMVEELKETFQGHPMKQLIETVERFLTAGQSSFAP